jgi:hypothetical protein
MDGFRVCLLVVADVALFFAIEVRDDVHGKVNVES